jgi:hypothetical protein
MTETYVAVNAIHYPGPEDTEITVAAGEPVPAAVVSGAPWLLEQGHAVMQVAPEEEADEEGEEDEADAEPEADADEGPEATPEETPPEEEPATEHQR